ncbi:MAG: phosphotransferase [Eubacteriales bacterium]|nr:phosphotransferase [Eubacteriales bacterium]
MMQEILLKSALGIYDLENPSAILIRHNENMTYKVTDGENNYVFYIHKPTDGYSLGIFEKQNRSDMLYCELKMLSALAAGTDLIIQKPISTKNGELFAVLPGGIPVSLLKWVDGETLESITHTPDHYRKIGVLTATLHNFFSSHIMDFSAYCRPSYDQSLLPSITEKIHAAYQTGVISEEQAKAVRRVLDEIEKRFDELDKMGKKIIVHADLSMSNMILTENGSISPIDFSLSGFGHFYMDIGSLFGHINNKDERKLVLEGYKSVRDCEIEMFYVEPYFALGVILFIACQYERAKGWDWFGKAMERWCREIFIPLAERKSLSLV